MFKNFNSITRLYFIFVFIFIILVTIFFTPFLNKVTIDLTSAEENHYAKIISTSNNICWPLPGYTRISSKFGYRSSPTAGASSFHGGIDLPAPAGTNIISAISGKVVRTGFMGSGRL